MSSYFTAAVDLKRAQSKGLGQRGQQRTRCGPLEGHPAQSHTAEHQRSLCPLGVLQKSGGPEVLVPRLSTFSSLPPTWPSVSSTTESHFIYLCSSLCGFLHFISKSCRTMAETTHSLFLTFTNPEDIFMDTYIHIYLHNDA